MLNLTRTPFAPTTPQAAACNDNQARPAVYAPAPVCLDRQLVGKLGVASVFASAIFAGAALAVACADLIERIL